MKHFRPALTPARSIAAGAGLDRSEEWLLLIVLYAVVVAVHIFALGDSYKFPHFSTDAVQYVTTAQNMAEGRGYSVRGVFNATNPPLYPAYLSVAFSFSRDPMWTAFLGQCLLSGLLVLPGYLLARVEGLGPTVAALLGTAAAMLPHTFFSAIFMTEVLQYPLFMWICFVAYRWLLRPTMKGSVWLGILLSLLMLNKLSSAVLLAPLLVACAFQKRMAVRLMLAPFLIVAASQGAWLLFKAAHGSPLLGMYGTILQEHGVGRASLPLLLCYASNFFLASGLLCAFPLGYFLLRRWRTERPIAVFFGLLFVVQILWIGIVEGGLTGALRERLISFSFPVAAILATRGFLDLQEDQPARWRYAFLAVPLLLVLGLALWNPQPPTPLDTPWIYAFRASFAVSAATVLIAGIVVVRANPSRATVLFAAGILLFNLYVFRSSAGFLSAETEHALGEAGRGIEWLKASGAGFGKRMIVVAPPSLWEMRRPPNTPDWLRSCLAGGIPNLMGLWQMEAYFRWDVRSVCTAEEIQRVARPGDLILTEEDLGHVPGISAYSDLPFHPLRLYQVAPKPAAAD